MAIYTEQELKEIGFKSVGQNVSISKNTSIYAPHKISIGDNVRIDDFCVLSGGEVGITIGSYVHIAVFCAIFGSAGVTMKDFSGLSSRVVIYSASDDYSGISLTNPTVPKEYAEIKKGEVILNKHVIIGTNSTVLPGVNIGEGVAVGAHTLVLKDLNPWSTYVGTPAKLVAERSKELLQKEKELMESLALTK